MLPSTSHKLPLQARGKDLSNNFTSVHGCGSTSDTPVLSDFFTYQVGQWRAHCHIAHGTISCRWGRQLSTKQWIIFNLFTQTYCAF